MNILDIIFVWTTIDILGGWAFPNENFGEKNQNLWTPNHWHFRWVIFPALEVSTQWLRFPFKPLPHIVILILTNCDNNWDKSYIFHKNVLATHDDNDDDDDEEEEENEDKSLYFIETCSPHKIFLLRIIPRQR